jgi:muconolactone delta-isomerase
MEHLVTMTTHAPEGTPETAVDDIRAREAAPLAPHPNDPGLAGR